jgi:hypothetical protein
VVARLGLQTSANLDQQRVAGGVAAAVVDRLESVEIDEQHSQRRGFGPASFDAVLQAIDQQSPRRQSGQRVGQGFAHRLHSVGVQQCDAGVFGQGQQHLLLRLRVGTRGIHRTDGQAADGLQTMSNRHGDAGHETSSGENLILLSECVVIVQHDQLIVEVRRAAQTGLGRDRRLKHGDLAVQAMTCGQFQ